MEETTILEEMIRSFKKRTSIQDEMVFEVIDKISECFVEEKDRHETYDVFLDRFNKIWQYHQFEQMASDQSYLFGAVWGSLRMLHSIIQKDKVSKDCYSLAMRHHDSDSFYNFLSSIDSNPGIQNRQLVNLCNVSAPRISQIARDALEEELISVQSYGKEKSYFLRTKGEKVYALIQKQRNQLEDKDFIPDFKVISFSNRQKDFSSRLDRMCCLVRELSPDDEAIIAMGIRQGGEVSQSYIKEFSSEYKELEGDLICNQISHLPTRWKNFLANQRETDMIKQPEFIE